MKTWNHILTITMGWYTDVEIHDSASGTIKKESLKYFSPRDLQYHNLKNCHGFLGASGTWDLVQEYGCGSVYFLCDSIGNIYLFCKGNFFPNFSDDMDLSFDGSGKFLCFFSKQKQVWYDMNSIAAAREILNSDVNLSGDHLDDLGKLIISYITNALILPLLLLPNNLLEESKPCFYDKCLWRTVIKYLVRP